MKKFAMGMMLFVFVSSQVFASGDSLKVTGENSVDLTLNNVSKRTHITFKDGHNNTLFEQTINEDGKFNKTFDLELLPDGDYTVEITNDVKTKILPLSISHDVVKVNNSEANEYYKPFVSEKEGKVYVNQFSPSHEPLYVAIYNNDNELVFEETLEGKMDMGKIYDFSKSFKGRYRIYLESKGMSYDYLVNIEK